MANRWIHTALFVSGYVAFTFSGFAQQTAPAGVYQGVAQPPSEMILENESSAAPKPSAAVVAPRKAAVPASSSVPTSTKPAATFPSHAAQPAAALAGSAAASDPDGDIVHPEASPAPAMQMAAKSSPVQGLAPRLAAPDPDGDIVHPGLSHPGQLAEGTMFRIELLDRLSSDENAKGDPFHGKVLADVMQNGKVLIPVGSTIEGRISAISSGHLAGHGSMRLTPQVLILPDSTRLSLQAEVSGTPGSDHHIDDEGGIGPGSRRERAGIEYGAVTGVGAATGAIFAGPVGALTGGLIGAGMVTTHLMVSHPQTTLDPGTTILFTLTEPLSLVPNRAAESH